MTIAKEHFYVNKFMDKAKEALTAGLDWLFNPNSAQFRLLKRGLETYVNTAKLITTFLDFFKIFLKV